jgi:hypothetical protein
VKDTGSENISMSGSYIWGKTCLLLYVAPRPALMTPSAGSPQS